MLAHNPLEGAGRVSCWEDSSTFLLDLGSGWEEMLLLSNLPTPPHLSFLLPDTVVLGPGQQPQVPVAGMIPRQETVTIPLNLYVGIQKGLVQWAVPSSHLAKWGLTSEWSCVS